MRHQKLAGIICIALLTAAPAMAAENRVGAETFATHCAACHGTTGLGDGEFADILTVKPPNLTTLSERNHGEFPYLATMRVIDGRTVVRGHGVLMPIWGEVFKDEIGDRAGPFGAELLIRAQIISLVDYIETLQK